MSCKHPPFSCTCHPPLSALTSLFDAPPRFAFSPLLCTFFSRAPGLSGTLQCDGGEISGDAGLLQVTHPVCSLGVGAMLHVDGEILVAGGDGSITKLRPLEMRSCEKPRAMLPGGITSLSRTADGSALIAGTSRGRIVR